MDGTGVLIFIKVERTNIDFFSLLLRGMLGIYLSSIDAHDLRHEFDIALRDNMRWMGHSFDLDTSHGKEYSSISFSEESRDSQYGGGKPMVDIIE
jgi:hypothetical protein